MKRIYLDHAATTPVAKEVLESMEPFFSQKFGNASSLYSLGREAKEAIDDSRVKAAKQPLPRSNQLRQPFVAPFIRPGGGGGSRKRAKMRVCFSWL